MNFVKRKINNILLCECHVAGTSYQNLPQTTENFEIGDKLLLEREPANKYDCFAISVRSINNSKIGYIPKDQNIVLSRLMDAGKIIQAFIIEKKYKGIYLHLAIRIFLLD